MVRSSGYGKQTPREDGKEKETRKGKIQSTLDKNLVRGGDKSAERKVRFEEAEMQKTVKNMGEEIEMCKKEIKSLNAKLKKERELRVELTQDLENCADKIQELEEEMGKLWDDMKEREREYDREGDTGSVRSLGSEWATMSCASMTSRSNFSEKEEKKLKSVVRKMEADERNEKKTNIAIRGIGKLDEKDLKKNLQDFLKEKLDVEVTVTEAWESGKVYIAKLATVEEKHEVMVNKGKLKETKIYIDNDMSYEERQVQVEIQGWVKKRRENGEEVKVGRGKVLVGDRWILWDVIKEQERVAAEKARRRKRMRRDEEEDEEENFA